MNKRTRIIQLLITAVLAAVIGASLSALITQSLGLGNATGSACMAAAAAALISAIMAYSTVGMLISLGLMLVGMGSLVVINMDAIGEAIAQIRGALSGEAVEAAGIASGAGAVAALLAFVLAAFMYLLIHKRAMLPVMIVTFGSVLVCNAFSQTAGIITGAPAIIVALAAYARSREIGEASFRILIPSVLAVVLAIVLVPAAMTTWEPLEEAAEKVREIYEDYFSFTQERRAFSINEKGFDQVILYNDQPTAALGGPANPDTSPVMDVETDSDLLLRGAIKSDYSGYSWTDDQVKSRYLYYDFTRRTVRSEVFDTDRLQGLDDGGAFEEISAVIRFTGEGTSTIFVPNKLLSLDMPLDTALYYNSIGEVFISREIEAGDEYSVTADIPVYGDEMEALVIQAAQLQDEGYAEAYENYTALPDCIEDGVYALAAELGSEADNSYAVATAIQDYLAGNFNYTLEPENPPRDRDFVSYFLLESKEGYCSYYASAMTVLCRMAGLPARYVEGYLVKAEEDGVTSITGENAHAWTEVYFNGIGWVPFDPTAAAQDAAGGEMTDDDELIGGQSDLSGLGEEPTPTPGLDAGGTLPPDAGPTLPPPEPTGEADEPTPPPESEEAPTPTPTAENQLPPEGENTPTPNPDLGMEQTPPSTLPPEGGEDTGDAPNLTWLWILLVLIILAGMAVVVVRMRLKATDPVMLVKGEKDPQKAMLILYRSILTLLLCSGQAPVNGETPMAFAMRMSRNPENPDFVEFSGRLTLNRYAGRAVDEEATALGLRAYLMFKNNMRRGEKLRFTIRRVLHGLGDFSAIP